MKARVCGTLTVMAAAESRPHSVSLEAFSRSGPAAGPSRFVFGHGRLATTRSAVEGPTGERADWWWYTPLPTPTATEKLGHRSR